jgi:hypothetical protein
VGHCLCENRQDVQEKKNENIIKREEIPFFSFFFLSPYSSEAKEGGQRRPPKTRDRPLPKESHSSAVIQPFAFSLGMSDPKPLNGSTHYNSNSLVLLVCHVGELLVVRDQTPSLMNMETTSSPPLVSTPSTRRPLPAVSLSRPSK